MTRSPAHSGTDIMTTDLKPEIVDMPLFETCGSESAEPAVIFVCTGNTCRSPMAEAYLKSRGYKNVCSRGLSAHEGAPISEFAVLALGEAGITPTPENDYPSHCAKNITDGDVARADAIYCMTSSHAKTLMFYCPQHAGKIHVLPHDISDPYGGSLDTYKKTFAEISSAIDEIFPPR